MQITLGTKIPQFVISYRYADQQKIPDPVESVRVEQSLSERSLKLMLFLTVPVFALADRHVLSM